MAINYHNHNINTSGTITSASGNFTTLVVNGTSVSNFNSSISGLLPTIANSGDNRILTSTGSSVGINAEANLTFNGSLLNVVGSGSFSSQTVFASGTAAAPGISILGDTDTGLCQISSVGTNSLSVSTSGVERLRFTSDGTTQIRANSSNISTLFTYNENGGELVHYDDAQAAATLLDQCNNQTRLLELINGSDLLLGLGGSNTTGSVRFMRAGFSEIMRINSSGNIGIGSSTNNDNIRTRLQVCGPDADDDPSLGSGTGALLVTNSDSAYGMQFGVSADGVGWIQQGRVDGTATAYNLLLNPVGGNVGIGTTSPSTKLQINGQTRVTDGTTNIDFVSSSAVGYIGTQTNHPLVLRTNDTERMRIGSNGNVTIGEPNTSNCRLMIAGTSSNISAARATYEGTLQINENSLSSLQATGGIEFKASVFGSGYGVKLCGYDNGSFVIGNRANSATWTERFVISQDGNVGIGNIVPAYRFEVRGAGAQARFYNSTTDAVVFIQGLTPASPWLGSGKSACQIDVDGWGGFAWQTDVTSGAKLFKLINNAGYGAGESTFLTVNASGKVGIGVTTNLTAALNFPQADSGEVINYYPSETEGVRSGVGKYSAEVRHYVPAGDVFTWRTGGPSGTERMKLSASLLTVGSSVSITASQVYSDTVGATNRDLFIDNTGKLGYVSSIRASKTNIAAIDDVSWLRDLTPVSFFYRRRNEDGTYSDEPDGTLDYGLIAEDVEAIAPELCFYDIVNNVPQLRGVHYSKLITPMLKYIQQLEDRIASLETRLGDNV